MFKFNEYFKYLYDLYVNWEDTEKQLYLKTSEI